MSFNTIPCLSYQAIGQASREDPEDDWGEKHSFQSCPTTFRKDDAVAVL